MELPDGTYISWWPAGKGKDGKGVLNWAACTAETVDSLREDIVQEDNHQPDVYVITSLDTAKMKAWWAKNKHGTYL